MAMVQDDGGNWKDDGTGVANPPRAPLDTAPDDVSPGDLQAGKSFQPMFQPLQVPEPARDAGWGGGEVAMGNAAPAGDPDVPAEPGGLPQPTSVTPGALPPLKIGGGGGGAAPAGPTSGQVVAHAQQQLADEAAGGVVDEKTKLEQQKAAALAEQDKQQAQAEAQQKADAKVIQDKLDATLKAQQDTLARDRIHDMFEGKPLAAVVAAISAGLGAFAATRSGGTNHAQGILDRAADMYRQKELHRFEQEEKAVGNTQRAQEHAETRADVATAALYQKFARDREVVLRKFGAQDAQVQSDALHQELLAKAAEHEGSWQDKTAGIAIQAVNDRATRAEKYAAAGKDNAEAMKARAEAGTVGTDKGAGGKGAVYMMKDAAMASQLKDDLDNYRSQGGGELSEAAKVRIQKNDRLLDAQHGKAGYAMLAGNVPGALVPTNRYDGLSAKDAAKANSLRLMAEKAASLMYVAGGEKSFEQLVREFDPTQPGSGTAAQKLSNITNITNVAAAHGAHYTDIAEAGKAAGYASGKAQPPPGAPAGSVRTTVKNPKTGQTMEAWKAPNGRLFTAQ